MPEVTLPQKPWNRHAATHMQRGGSAAPGVAACGITVIFEATVSADWRDVTCQRCLNSAAWNAAHDAWSSSH